MGRCYSTYPEWKCMARNPHMVPRARACDCCIADGQRRGVGIARHDRTPIHVRRYTGDGIGASATTRDDALDCPR